MCPGLLRLPPPLVLVAILVIGVLVFFLSSCVASRPANDPLDVRSVPWQEGSPPAPDAAPPSAEPDAPAGPATQSSRTLVGRVGCLIRLRELGIAHLHLTSLRGVETPVRIAGPIDGIVFRPMGRLHLVGDCRLALALHRAAPVMRELGITEIHFSNAYSYRMMPSGKPSLHAMGLAIDVHRVVADGVPLEVSEDFELDLEQGEGCALNAPALNRLACRLKGEGIFDQVLTPDFDRAHYNHLHLAIREQRRAVEEP